MKKTIAKLLLIGLLCNAEFETCIALPQGPMPDSVFAQNIKTVLLYKQGWEFSYPILQLNNNEPLVFSFDEIYSKAKNYNYSVVLCDADWVPTRLSFMEYMDGFFQNPLNNYDPSFSTYIPYTHYSLQIPNENVKLKLSGNYALVVYENGNDDEPILIKRFIVADDKVDIVCEVNRPVLPEYQDEYQQLNFSIQHTNYMIDNPQQTVKINIVKNGMWRFSVGNINPQYIRDDAIMYHSPDKNLLLGGNEYRSFDLKSLKYQSANIESINYIGETFKIVLNPDSPRKRNAYFYNEEFNGKYLIQNQQGHTPENDAEYVHVLFSFKRDINLDEGDIYVFGAFTNFTCSNNNKMIFNSEKGVYELDMLVKQGYYNYQYVFMPNNSNQADETYFEGSYYETENDYLILVYHRPYGARYDQLISAKVVNSLKRQQ